MKLAKKLMVAAAALAAFGLMGCANNEDEFGILDFDSVRNSCTVNYTNTLADTDTNNARGWATFNTGHVSANCLITFENQTTSSKDGNMGFIFDLTKKDDAYNFYLCTLQNNKGQMRYYISYFENVGAQYLSSGSNFKDKDGNPAKEYAITSGDSGWVNLDPNVVPDTNGNIRVIIQLSFDENNGYTIELYNVKEDKGKFVPNSIVSETKTLKTYGLEKKQDGKYKKPDNDMGAYAMVFGGKTLTGSWKFTDFQNNEIILEEVDIR